jgi:uncharacterized membrane protein
VLKIKNLRIFFILILSITLSILFTSSLFAQEEGIQNVTPSVVQTKQDYYKGIVLEIMEEKEVHFQSTSQMYQKLSIKIISGQFVNDEVVIENGSFPVAQVTRYEKGDSVIIAYKVGIDGKDVFSISDFARTQGLLLLFGIFIIFAVIIGAKKGFYSLFAMVISFAVLFMFLLPQIQLGRDPVLVSILSSLIIAPITFYLSHGFSFKTTVAIVGTFVSLIITGLLAILFTNMVHLNGTATEEAMFLQTTGDFIFNLKGLLLAGIIVGTLGVLDDITISQTAIVYQIYDIKKDISFNELFKRSIGIGKDHIASVINTLVLVYTGASLPLLILFTNSSQSFETILNTETVATEIVRTLVGSIGLIIAVPITTYIACIFARKNYRFGIESNSDEHAHSHA